jgi:allophanate hydrolase subunit 2
VSANTIEVEVLAPGLLTSVQDARAATDLLAGFGGLAGRALRAGDRLAAPSVPDVVTRCGRHLTEAGCPPDPEAPVRILPGPHLGRFKAGTLDALCASTWRIADEADRMGYRLAGPRLCHVRGADITSLGLPIGAVQVPGDGQPVVLLADHQPTGGYTVLACVIRADLRLLAQRAPGDSVRFALTTPAEARAAVRAQRASLEQLRPGEDAWAPLRWAGTGPEPNSSPDASGPE